MTRGSAALGGGGVVVAWAWRDELAGQDHLLSADERERSQRMRPPLGRRWAATRAWVRVGLASHLDVAPADVAFTVTADGRPRLAEAPLDFNVSHTDGLVVLACSPHAVGVDVENPLGDGDDPLALASVVGTPAEVAELSSLPVADRPLAFQRWWVRKEAVLKGQGTGFLADAASVHVGVLAPAPPSPWRVIDLGALPPGAGAGAALVAVAVGGEVDVTVDVVHRP